MEINNLKGYALVLLSALSYSILTILLKIFSNIPILNEYQILFYRFSLAAIFIFIIKYNQLNKIKKSDIHKYLILGGLYALTSLYFYRAIIEFGAIQATVLLFSYPLFVFIINVVFKRVFSLKLLLVAIISCIGSYLTLSSEQLVFELGNILIFLPALFCCAYIWSSEKFKIGNGIIDTGLIFVFSSIILLVLNFKSIFSISLFQIDFKLSIVLIAISILTITSVYFFLKGVYQIGSFKSSIIASTEPAITLIITFLIFQTQVNSTQIIGVALIIMANSYLAKRARLF